MSSAFVFALIWVLAAPAKHRRRAYEAAPDIDDLRNVFFSVFLAQEHYFGARQPSSSLLFSMRLAHSFFTFVFWPLL